MTKPISRIITNVFVNDRIDICYTLVPFDVIILNDIILLDDEYDTKVVPDSFIGNTIFHINKYYWKFKLKSPLKVSNFYRLILSCKDNTRLLDLTNNVFNKFT